MSGPLDSAKIPTASVVGGTYNVVAPAPVDGQSLSLQQDASGNLLVNVAVGGGSSGTVKIEDTTGASLLSNGSGALNVAVVSGGGSNASVGTIGAAAPTSATEIGVVDGSGNLQHITTNSTTFTSKFAADVNLLGTLGTAFTTAGFVDIKGADGNVFVRQATAANLNATVVQGTSPWVVSLSSTTITGTVAENLTQVAGTSLGATAVTNFGSAPAAAAVPGVNASLFAGVTGITATGTSLNTNITNTSGPFTVAQATAANLNAQVQGTAAGDAAASGNPVLVAGVDASGNIQEIPIVDAGTTVTSQTLLVGGTDGTNGRQFLTDTSGRQVIIGSLTNNNAAPAATEVGVLPALANAASPAWTEGDQVLESVDLHGGQRAIGGNIPEATAAWTSATASNTVLQMTVTGYTTVLVTFNQTTTITGGVATFEASDASTNWYPIIGYRSNNSLPTTGQTYSFAPNTNTSFQFSVAGYVSFRVRLSTVISGTGTVNVGLQAQASPYTAYATFIQNTVSVGSQSGSSALADNQTTTNFFTSVSNASEPLAVGDWVYGGAFSGTPNAALQGWSKMRAPTIFKTVSATASGNTAIWTPGSGNKFRLLKLFVEVTDQAAISVAGTLTIDIQDASTSTNITFSVFVPASVTTPVIGDGAEIQLDLGSIGYLSSAANNVLNVNLSSALTAGVVRVIAMGTEE